MKPKEKKSFNYQMRSLHRDIGFLVLGFTLIFCISGIVMIFRNTDFLEKDRIIERTLSPHMDSSDIGKELHIRDFKILKEVGDIAYFQSGTYNKTTGEVIHTSKEQPAFLNRLKDIHTTSSRNIIHWFTLIYGVSLFFLAISSLWMFKPKTKLFKRGIVFVIVGFTIAAIVILISKLE